MADILERQGYLQMAGRLSAVVWAKERGTWSDTFSGILDELYNQLMDDEDLFCYDNQQRADRNLGPTSWFMELYNALVEFVEAGPYTDDPGVVYHCKEWIKLAKDWYPNISVSKAEPERHTPDDNHNMKRGAVSVNIEDKSKFESCFSRKFLDSKTFDNFYYALCSMSFTKTDWGCIAYAIQDNKGVACVRVENLKFAKWMREFFGIIGLECPGDVRPAHYNEKKRGTLANEFILQWLKM